MNNIKIYGLKELKIVFPGFKVQRGTESVSMYLSEELATIAKQKDPNQCLWGWALKFQFPKHIIPFAFPSRTYLVDTKKKTITLYRNEARLTALIRGWDKNQIVLEEGYYTMSAPCPSMNSPKPVGTKTPGTGRSGKRKAVAMTFEHRYAEWQFVA